jgi:hypothetical protein
MQSLLRNCPSSASGITPGVDVVIQHTQHPAPPSRYKGKSLSGWPSEDLLDLVSDFLLEGACLEAYWQFFCGVE